MAVTRRSSRISTMAAAKAEMPAKTTSDTNNRKRKAANLQDVAQAPATPPRKRAQGKPATPAAPPPVTPTPAAARAFADPTSSSKKPRSAAVTRLADPKLTNATLLSPETSRLVASRDLENVSPSKTPQAKTTTENLLKEACDYLI